MIKQRINNGKVVCTEKVVQTGKTGRLDGQERLFFMGKSKEEVFKIADAIQGWFPRNDMETLWMLGTQFIPKGGLVVEVGSWKGRSSYLLASICQERGARLICIDSFRGLLAKDNARWDAYHGPDGSYAEANEKSIIRHIRENLKEFDVDIREGDSRELHKILADKSVDFLFLDGDHELPAIAQDLDNFWPKVKNGGIFCGHDYDKGNDLSKEVDKRHPNKALFGIMWKVQK